jgi:drug/metabolite transporter (DMT)-like permease
MSAIVLGVAALWPTGAPGAAFAMGQRFVAPSPIDFLMLALIGFLGGAGQIMMTHSYRYADASVIAAFDYTAMIWAVALGLLLFGEAPSARILAGAAIVVASGIFVLWREHRMRRIVRPSRSVPATETHEKSLLASQIVR